MATKTGEQMAGEEQAGTAAVGLRSSVRLPWLCAVLTLLLLAGAAFAALDRPVSTGAVPGAVLGTQTHLTEEYAQALAEQYNRVVSYGTEVVGQLDASPDMNQASYFTGLSGQDHPWTWLELVDTSLHKVIAGAGTIDAGTASALRNTRLPNSTERALATESGSSVLRVYIPLESSQDVLVMTAPLRLTASGGAEAQLVDEQGDVLLQAGSALPGTDQVRAHATRSVSDGFAGALTAGAGTASPAVVSYAPITLTSALNNTADQTVDPTSSSDQIASMGLGLVVERGVGVAGLGGIDDSGQLRLALAAGLAMLAIALFAGSLLWFGIIGPIRRLARQSAEIPAVGVLDMPGWSGEARDLGRNMHKLAIAFSTEASPSRRAAVAGSLWARLTSGIVVLCVALLPVLGWAAGVTYAVYRTAPIVVPGQVAVDQGRSTGVLAESLRQRLSAASVDLSTVAVAARTAVTTSSSHQVTIASNARLQTLVESVTAASTAYKSVYVVNGSGTVLALAGSSPRASVKAGTVSGLVEGATSGRTALLYAVQPIGGGDAAVAEFSDAQLLPAVQHTSLGTVNLVDAEDRVLLSNASFTAYAVSSTLAHGASEHVDGAAIEEAAAVTAGGMHFAVTTDRATSKIAVSGVVLRQTVQLLAMLAVTTALLCGGWIYLMVLMPLRRLERRARDVVDGDYTEAVVPQRADEIGRLSRALDLLRRAAKRGRGQPIPVQFNAASAWSETSLLPKLK
ncbi:MAG TPA: HAMP domain-containing protein [Actinospica sp.]|nr:HAMP domain-containing protein [Actinospica sp.]